MNYNPELLAPAGDLQKLKIAILYGANAVFIGGKKFSLRAKASNFEIADIAEGVAFAHAHQAKVYVTVNIYPHNEDFEGLDEYLLELDAIHVDAIIVSSPYIVSRARALHCHFELHISTQQSTANHHAVQFWKDFGVDRVVLARELSLQEIKSIKNQVNLPIEVFIHGGMCSSFSGRCTLSNNMTNRDANRGGCAHSCRWNYRLFQANQEVSTHDFKMGSKDLMAFAGLQALLDARVDSFKIEGRMKSLHYIAMVVRAYRGFIDHYIQEKPIDQDILQYFKTIAQKAENRDSSTGFLLGDVTNEGTLYDTMEESPSQEFIGLVVENQKNALIKIQQRNFFSVGDRVEIIEPSGRYYEAIIHAMQDEEGNSLTQARHAMQILYLDLHTPIKVHSIIRKKQED